MQRVLSKATHQWLQTFPNNNRGHWYLVNSRLTKSQLEKHFKEGSVGHALYQRVGAIVQAVPPSLYLQISPYQDKFVDRPSQIRQVQVYAFGVEWAVTCCLEDLNITIVRRATEAEVRFFAEGH